MQSDGRLLGGRYALDELIATGGMGEVWRGRDTRLHRDVAVKVLRSQFTADPTFLARFRAESRHSAGLVHPNIATLFDYGEVTAPTGEQVAFLVMELVRGESLSKLLQRERRLPPDRTLEVLRECAAGLAAAHAAGVVHRDVKPGNVLLGMDGAVKLTDFGVAVSAASVPLTRTGELIGTAHYLSPEQVQGGRATPASDVYALGLVGYECLAGHRAFDGATPVEVAVRRVHEQPPPLPADVPQPVHRLIDRALAGDPAARFADGSAFRTAVDDVLRGRPGGDRTAEPRTMVLPAVRANGTGGTPIPPLPATHASALSKDAEVDDLGEIPGHRDDAGPAPRRRWPLVLAAVLAVLALAGASYGFLRMAAQPRESPTADPTTSTASSPPTATQLYLTAADYVGRPVGEVQAELLARGLQVALQPHDAGAVPVDQVTAVDPAGQLARGSVVTVRFAVAPQPTPTLETPPTETGEGNGDQGDGGNGNGDEGGGNGKGRGGGNGGGRNDDGRNGRGGNG